MHEFLGRRRHSWSVGRVPRPFTRGGFSGPPLKGRTEAAETHRDKVGPKRMLTDSRAVGAAAPVLSGMVRTLDPEMRGTVVKA